MLMQQGSLKPRVLPLFIALVCTRRMQRAQMGDMEIFKHLIEIRQNRRSYC